MDREGEVNWYFLYSQGTSLLSNEHRSSLLSDAEVLASDFPSVVPEAQRSSAIRRDRGGQQTPMTTSL